MLFEDPFLSSYNGSEPYIFLSYSHKDAKEAAEIIRQFKKDAYRIWYDDGITPAVEWDEDIAQAIIKSSFFIALISKNYLNSQNCRDELNFAREKKKNRLLIYLEDVELPEGMSMRLNRLQAVHKYLYKNQTLFYAKAYASNGIEICQDRSLAPEITKDEEESIHPAENDRITSGSTYKTRLLSALKYIIPLIFVAAIIIYFFLSHRQEDNLSGKPVQHLADSIVTEASTEEIQVAEILGEVSTEKSEESLRESVSKPSEEKESLDPVLRNDSISAFSGLTEDDKTVASVSDISEKRSG